uniref:PH domain-containing protein n=1 Tax=Chromera velia CCMP2878 TaxID=1169474 RepID=A0A0G4FRZ1_9ALVE|eukprot:Cvel_18464.t1-p1 / transcript=Cvel_18464.t1 / gene=Cvel_18464 / organism=Chromera_velia_CCMP2878 / gene_product=hypothetical protein / transcript_product=hypothetical protein / location=Cvel_scaffold1530:4174-14372(-) / protein_length=2098 / sequence_SO=supercontig / SO=protein_coding / is_pseudo=false
MPPKKEERKKGTWRATSPPRQRADNTSSDPAQEDAPVAQPSSSERASAGKRQRTTMDSEKKKFDEDVIELQSSLFRLKGNYRKRWVSEWFALQHNFFISFRSQDRLEVKKCIALVSIIEVKKMPVKRHPTQFAVQYALGPDFKKLELLLLKAETPDLGEQWISTLTESVKKAKAADPSHSHALGHFLTLTDAFRRYQTMKGEMFHHHLSSVFRSVYRMGRARERFLCAFFFAQMRRHVRSEKEKEHVMKVEAISGDLKTMNEALIASAHHLPLSQGVSSLDFLFRARNQRLALAALHTMRTETQRASAREQALLRGLMKGVKRIARVGAERVKREALTTLRQRVAHEFKKEALIRLEVSTTGRRALPFSRIAASLLNRHKKAHAAAAASALSGRRGQTRGGTKQGGGPVMRTVLESPAGRGGGLAIRTLPSIDSAGGLVEGDYDEEDDGEGLGVIGGFLVGKNGGGGLEASAEERNQFISRLRLALFTFAAALRNLERKRQHAQFVALLQFQRNKRGAELLQTLVRSMCTRRLVPLAAARQRLKALAALKDLQLHAATTSGSLLEKQIRRIAGRGKEEGDGGMVSSAHQVLQSAIHSARTGEGEGGLKGRRTDSPSSRVRVSAEVQGGDQPVSIRSGQWEVNVVPSASPSPSPTHGGRESSGIPATRLHALRDSQSGTPAGLLRSGQTVSRYPTTAALSSALHGGGWVGGGSDDVPSPVAPPALNMGGGSGKDFGGQTAGIGGMGPGGVPQLSSPSLPASAAATGFVSPGRDRKHATPPFGSHHAGIEDPGDRRGGERSSSSPSSSFHQSRGGRHRREGEGEEGGPRRGEGYGTPSEVQRKGKGRGGGSGEVMGLESEIPGGGGEREGVSREVLPSDEADDSSLSRPQPAPLDEREAAQMFLLQTAVAKLKEAEIFLSSGQYQEGGAGRGRHLRDDGGGLSFPSGHGQRRSQGGGGGGSRGGHPQASLSESPLLTHAHQEALDDTPAEELEDDLEGGRVLQQKKKQTQRESPGRGGQGEGEGVEFDLGEEEGEQPLPPSGSGSISFLTSLPELPTSRSNQRGDPSAFAPLPPPASGSARSPPLRDQRQGIVSPSHERGERKRRDRSSSPQGAVHFIPPPPRSPKREGGGDHRATEEGEGGSPTHAEVDIHRKVDGSVNFSVALSRRESPLKQREGRAPSSPPPISPALPLPGLGDSPPARTAAVQPPRQRQVEEAQETGIIPPSSNGRVAVPSAPVAAPPVLSSSSSALLLREEVQEQREKQRQRQAEREALTSVLAQLQNDLRARWAETSSPTALASREPPRQEESFRPCSLQTGGTNQRESQKEGKSLGGRVSEAEAQAAAELRRSFAAALAEAENEERRRSPQSSGGNLHIPTATAGHTVDSAGGTLRYHPAASPPAASRDRQAVVAPEGPDDPHTRRPGQGLPFSSLYWALRDRQGGVHGGHEPPQEALRQGPSLGNLLSLNPSNPAYPTKRGDIQTSHQSAVQHRDNDREALSAAERTRAELVPPPGSAHELWATRLAPRPPVEPPPPELERARRPLSGGTSGGSRSREGQRPVVEGSSKGSWERERGIRGGAQADPRTPQLLSGGGVPVPSLQAVHHPEQADGPSVYLSIRTQQPNLSTTQEAGAGPVHTAVSEPPRTRGVAPTPASVTPELRRLSASSGQITRGVGVLSLSPNRPLSAVALSPTADVHPHPLSAGAMPRRTPDDFGSSNMGGIQAAPRRDGRITPGHREPTPGASAVPEEAGGGGGGLNAGGDRQQMCVDLHVSVSSPPRRHRHHAGATTERERSGGTGDFAGGRGPPHTGGVLGGPDPSGGLAALSSNFGGSSVSPQRAGAQRTSRYTPMMSNGVGMPNGSLGAAQAEDDRAEKEMDEILERLRWKEKDKEGSQPLQVNAVGGDAIGEKAGGKSSPSPTRGPHHRTMQTAERGGGPRDPPAAAAAAGLTGLSTQVPQTTTTGQGLLSSGAPGGHFSGFSSFPLQTTAAASVTVPWGTSGEASAAGSREVLSRGGQSGGRVSALGGYAEIARGRVAARETQEPSNLEVYPRGQQQQRGHENSSQAFTVSHKEREKDRGGGHSRLRPRQLRVQATDTAFHAQ